MNATVPFLRTVGTAWQQPCSRIPHLRIHILQHQARAARLRKTRPFDAGQKRLQHTYTSLSYPTDALPHVSPDSELAKPESGHSNNIANRHNADAIPDKADTTSDGLVSIYDVVQEGHPDRVLSALLDPRIGESFILNADNAAFERALCALQPEYFIEPFKPIYRTMSPSLSKVPAEPVEPRFLPLRALQDRFAVFLSVLDSIIVKRTSAGHRVGLPVCQHLLSCAEATGDYDLAKFVFEDLMPRNDVQPDLKCYNSFLGAMVWSNAYGTEESFKLRVLPRALAIRSKEVRRRPFAGHRTSPPSRPNSLEKGIRLAALKAFRELIGGGMAGDEATFTNLMLAMGREGDISGVQSILKSVWNIDLELLAKFDEEEIQSPTFYEDDSPLRPTERLLFTIVHVFCINNDIGLASSVLDYVSRNYNLAVPQRIWMHLYMWAYALSTPRSLRARKRGEHVGKLDLGVVERFYNVITDEPHNIEPNIYMLTMAANNRRKARSLDQALDRLRQSIRLLDEERTELSILYDEMLDQVRQLGLKHSLWDGFLPASFYDSRRRFLVHSLKVESHRDLITKAVRNILQEDDFPGSGNQTKWAHQRLPNIIKEFQQYLPFLTFYQTPTCKIVLKGKVHSHIAIESANGFQLSHVGILRRALDTEDHNKLMEGLSKVEDQLLEMDRRCSFCNQLTHTTMGCPRRRGILVGRLQGDLHREVWQTGTGSNVLAIARDGL